MAALPSLPVRGRDAQLAVLDERLKQARDGIGSVWSLKAAQVWARHGCTRRRGPAPRA